MKLSFCKKLFTPEVFSKKDVWCIGILACCFFILFQHDDLYATANHAYLLADLLFHGDFFNFYARAAEGNSPFAMGAAYHIFVYLLLMIWVLPFYAVSRIFPGISGLFLVFWSKIFLCIFFVLNGLLLTRIGGKLNFSPEKNNALFWGWITAPAAVFAVVLFGQYDVFSIFFSLLAFDFFLDKKLWRFTITAAFAACFKNFAFFMWLPLLLLAEKNILKIFLHTVCAVIPAFLLPLLFRKAAPEFGGSAAFQSMIADRFFEHLLPTGIPTALFPAAGILILFFAWFKTPENREEYLNWAVLLPFMMFSLLFLSIEWHIHWLILIVPWSMLSFWRCGKKIPAWQYLVLEAGFFIGAFGFEMLKSTGRVDNTMIQYGLLPLINPEGIPHTTQLAFYPGDILSLIPSAKICFGSLFASSVMAQVWLCTRKTERNSPDIFFPDRKTLLLRGALILFFVIPSFLSEIRCTLLEQRIFPTGFPKERVYLFWLKNYEGIQPPSVFTRLPVIQVRPAKRERISMGEISGRRQILLPVGAYSPTGVRQFIVPFFSRENVSGKTVFELLDGEARVLYRAEYPNGRLKKRVQKVCFDTEGKGRNALWLRISSSAETGQGVSIPAWERRGKDIPSSADDVWLAEISFIPFI